MERRKRACIVIDHGSRRAEANAVGQALTEALGWALSERWPTAVVRVAHLEVATPTLLEAVRECVREGARWVFVQPLFFAPGKHAQEDIPALIAAAQAEHPAVVFRMGRVLGADPTLVRLLAERFVESVAGEA